MRKAASALTIALVSVAALAGCASNAGAPQKDATEIRYQQCLKAGGSYWEDLDYNKFSCTLPNAPIKNEDR